MSGYSTHEQQRNDLSEEKAESRRLAAELDALKKYPTIERPTESGWYWFRSALEGKGWRPTQVFEGRGAPNAKKIGLYARTADHRPLLLSTLLGEWRGPIPEPAP